MDLARLTAGLPMIDPEVSIQVLPRKIQIAAGIVRRSPEIAELLRAACRYARAEKVHLPGIDVFQPRQISFDLVTDRTLRQPVLMA